MNAGQFSLFDAPMEPVTGNAGEWFGGLLGGEIMSSLCIIAIALLGLSMLGGRLPVRAGLKVVAGCFVLFSASVLAGGLQGLARNVGGGSVDLQRGSMVVEADPAQLPPANHDPYAGASLRRR